MSKKIIIIGGGIAGLSAGIYGRMNGYETEIIEMNKIPGGQCTAWDRKGYRFDYCLHWLVGTKKGPFHRIWQETGVLNPDVKILDHEIHTLLVDENGNEFIVYTNADRWEKYLLELAPEDAVPIRKMCMHIRKGSKLEAFENAPGVRKFKEYFPGLLKMLPALLLIIKYSKKSTLEYFRELNFKNERLKRFLFDFFTENNMSAIAFIGMLGWFQQNNAGYLIGGSLPITQRMAEKYKSLGGILKTSKKVEKIIVENNNATGVVLTDGTKIMADFVVGAADGHSIIFDMLGGKYISKEIDTAYKTWPLFPSLVQVSFGIGKEVKTDFTLQSVVMKGEKIGNTILESPCSIMNYCYDPTLSPEGKTAIVIRYESPWEIWENMAEEEYKAEKKQIEKDAMVILEKRYPGISGHIEVVDVATPRTSVEYTGVWKGAYEGFLPTKNNMTKVLKMTLPGLDHFYLIGQWLYPGGGLPPSAQSGKWAIQLICKKDKVNFNVH